MSSRKYRRGIGHADMKSLLLAGPLHQIVQHHVVATWNAVTSAPGSVAIVVWDDFTSAVKRNVNAV